MKITYTPETTEELRELVDDEAINLGDIDTHLITDMSYLFAKSPRKDFSGIEKWDTHNVEKAVGMFAKTEFFNADISNLNFSNVKDASYMFFHAKAFDRDIRSLKFAEDCNFEGILHGTQVPPENIPEQVKGAKGAYMYRPRNKEELKALIADESIYLGDIDTSAITDMSYLFEGVDRKDFSGIEEWDTGNVEDMSWMFYGTYMNQPIGCWNVAKVKNFTGMFCETPLFDQPLNDWDTRSAEDMSYMFNGAVSFNKPLENWKVSHVKSMKSMFESAVKFCQPIGNWIMDKVENVTNMFKNAKAFIEDVSKWSLKKNIPCEEAFVGCPISEKNKPKSMQEKKKEAGIIR